MKMLKPLTKPKLLVTQKEEPKKEEKKTRKKNNEGKLPPDTYKDEITPLELEVDENRKFVLSVKRGGDDGLLMCDIRQFNTTEMYTGFTKKGITFPTELLLDLMELLQEVHSECEEKELFND